MDYLNQTKKMTLNKLNFESEELVIYQIFFKFQKLENFSQIKIADYIFKLEVNYSHKSENQQNYLRNLFLFKNKKKFGALLQKE